MIQDAAYWIFRDARNESDCKNCVRAKFLEEGVFCYKKMVMSLCGAKDCDVKELRNGPMSSAEFRRAQLEGLR